MEKLKCESYFGDYKCHVETSLKDSKGRPIYVDKCIKDAVEKLNSNGIKTSASCCGHGIVPPSIVSDVSIVKRKTYGNIEEKKYYYKRFEEYFRNLSDESKFRLIAKKAADVKKCHAKMIRTSEIELNNNIPKNQSTRTRGGKATSLMVNSFKATDEFFDSLKMLQFMIKIIGDDLYF